MKIKHLLVHIQNSLSLFFCTLFLNSKSECDYELVKFGSDYGGWLVPRNCVATAELSGGLLISAGIGFDVTFDISLYERNFSIIAIDPGVESCRFARKELPDRVKVKIINKALWKFSGLNSFFQLNNGGNLVYKLNKGSSSKSQVLLDCITLDEIISDDFIKVHKNNLILKLDIEGAEIDLIDSVLALNIDFQFIAMELDSLALMPFLSLIKRISTILLIRKKLKQMKSRGYSLIKNDNFNFYWINKRSGGGGI